MRVSTTTFLVLVAFFSGCLLSWNVRISRQFSTPASPSPWPEGAALHAPLSPVRVVLALSGSHWGPLAEFEAALKSILRNAPHERDLYVHVLADGDAFHELVGGIANGTRRDDDPLPGRPPPLLERIELPSWTTRNAVEVHVHDVDPELPALKRRVAGLFRDATGVDYDASKVEGQLSSGHTLGTYDRLIVHRVVSPPSSSGRPFAVIGPMLYLDTDVVVLSNLEGLWTEVERHPDALFHWGASACAGFVVLNVPRLEEVWSLAGAAPLWDIAVAHDGHALNDQLLLLAVNVTHPGRVNLLPDGWDLHATTRWRPKEQRILEFRYPDAGMLHLNGGAESKVAYLEKLGKGSTFMNAHVARYYTDLPWTWARYQARSEVRPGEAGHVLRVHAWASDGQRTSIV